MNKIWYQDKKNWLLLVCLLFAVILIVSIGEMGNALTSRTVVDPLQEDLRNYELYVGSKLRSGVACFDKDDMNSYSYLIKCEGYFREAKTYLEDNKDDMIPVLDLLGEDYYSAISKLEMMINDIGIMRKLALALGSE
jgi:hypothetical protein